MRQLFGLITLFLGILLLATATCAKLEVVEASERMKDPKAFLLAILFLVYGYTWMQNQTIE